MKKKVNVSSSGSKNSNVQLDNLRNKDNNYLTTLGGWFVIITSFAFYLNTLKNGHALDDVMMITQNSFVNHGLQYWKSIFTKDSMVGFIGSDDAVLPGGRYRPLSLLMFAVEWEFFGDNPFVGHLINVILFAFTCYILWKLLSQFIFKTNPVVALIAVTLFAIHPIHTEVVANIKSRDEILSLLLSILSLYFLFKHEVAGKKSKFIVYSALFFLLGLFSKENTLMFLVVMPLALFCFSSKSVKDAIKVVLPHFLLATVFLVIRFKVIGFHKIEETEILNNPFLIMTFQEKYATIFETLLKYGSLLIFPYPLSHDYSFNQIPATSFSSLRVLLSLVLFASLIVYALLKIKNKSNIGFGILYFFITFSITSNFVINIGAPMGERFLYMPSAGFCLVVAILLFKLYEKLRQGQGSVLANVIFVITGLLIFTTSAYGTINRNKDWENDITLDIRDVKTVPNSAIANQRCGTAYINLGDSVKLGRIDSIPDTAMSQKYIAMSIPYFQKAIQIYPKYAFAYLNCGVAFLQLNKLDEAESCYDSAEKYHKNLPSLPGMRNVLGHHYLNNAITAGQKGDLNFSFYSLQKAEKYLPLEADVFYNYGGYYYTTKDYKKAKEAWMKCLKLKPGHAQAELGIKALPPGS